MEDIDEVKSISSFHPLAGLTPRQSQISGENGEVYLFQWLSSTEKMLKDATPVRIVQQSIGQN
jgi:hypothetical protein